MSDNERIALLERSLDLAVEVASQAIQWVTAEPIREDFERYVRATFEALPPALRAEHERRLDEYERLRKMQAPT